MSETKPRPYATVKASQLASTTAPLQWLLTGLFLRAGAGILGGAPKTGKSFFALELAVAVASQTSAAGYFEVPSAAPVLLLCAEDPHAVVIERLNALCRSRGRLLQSLPLDLIVEPVLLPQGLDRLALTLAQSTPGLLLLDPLIRIHRADENSASEMSVILDGLRALSRDSQTAILLVHHARKAAPSSWPGTGLRGSSDLAAFGDSNLYFKRLAPNGLLELRVEHRAAASPDPLRFKLVIEDDGRTARFHTVDNNPQEEPSALRILALLRNATEPLSSTTVRDKLGVRNQTVLRTLRALNDQGRVQRSGRDGWTLKR
jgi:hypothetical protein